ncbi:MAG: glycoside hydrolase family 5 protein [Candidatus Bathyarchaeota archaeon]|nr:glycoside hydrolase family 5 protein [Candidatus Bathyarchaeota archaeon]
MNKKLVISTVSLLTITLIATLPLVDYHFNSTKTMALHTSGSKILDAYGNVVYLRGIGRSGDLQSPSGMWSEPGEQVFSWDQKWRPIEENLHKMDATLQCYRDYWHVNMIRIFIPVDWWWTDNISRATYEPEAANITISYRHYLETLVQEAAKYGIYVDLCPYSAVNGYLFSRTFEGEPGTWVPNTASYQFIQTVTSDAGRNEMEFWRLWWGSVVERLGGYRNVIFELWNEPGDNKTAFFSYMIEAYKTIRNLGNQNLVFMQWEVGIVPGWQSLTWAPELFSQLKNATSKAPLNVAFTTHTYMHSPYPNLQWAHNYEEVKRQLNAPDMVPQTRNINCTVPLVFNEMGVLDADFIYNYWASVEERFGGGNLTLAQRRAREYSFWTAILQNAKDLGIGVCAYYWMQDSVSVAYGYAGEALVSSDVWTGGSPTPNFAGKTFIETA